MNEQRNTRPFGDGALVAEVQTTSEALRLAESVRMASWRGVEDVVPGQMSVTVIFDPRVADTEQIDSDLKQIELAALADRSPRLVEIPTTFDGADLEEVSQLCSMSEEQFVRCLVTARLEAAFLGFAPGFAYLTGLPEALGKVPRRSTPRTVVEAGSVAIAGGFAAVYPTSSPGGWHVVGHTNLALFDPETPPFSLIQAGDMVRLVEAADLPPARCARARRPLHCSDSRSVKIEQSGLLSLVEDAGRSGFASIGVPRAGGADATSLKVSNRLVGNEDGAATIELTGRGPTVRVNAPMHAVVVGDVEVRLGERLLPSSTVFPMETGQVLSVGTLRSGLRGYLSFAGGLQVPEVMGSRSTDTLFGLGSGPLQAGDVIGVGAATHARGLADVHPPAPAPAKLRVIVGPEEFDARQTDIFGGTTWEVGSDSDRVGVRLNGPAIRPPTEGIPSRGTVTGAVQVPPDGGPIVLLCDHATVGGYPVIAVVVEADVAALGQLRPGDPVTFSVVDRAAARVALAASERALDNQITGWYPSRTD